MEPEGSLNTSDLPNTLLNPNVHHRVHMSHPLVPIVSQINLVILPHPISL
jgi:hypothetical protein